MKNQKLCKKACVSDSVILCVYVQTNACLNTQRLTCARNGHSFKESEVATLLFIDDEAE